MLQASGQISLSQVQVEFGGSNPISFSEYYKGGLYVPSITENANVPSSGQISLSNYYSGSKGPVITLNAVTAGSTDYQKFLQGSISPTTVNGIEMTALYHITQSPPTQEILHVEFASNLAILGVKFVDRIGVLREYLVASAIMNTGKVYRWDIGIVPFNSGAQYQVTIEL